MSQQLRTLKDFERVAKALEDPNAKPHEYEVKSFGYCKNCKAVVAYESEASIEWLYQKCLSCGMSKSNAMGSFNYLILTWVLMPNAFRPQVDTLYSREKQREFFDEVAKKRVEELAAESREYELKHVAAETQAIKLSELRNKVKHS